MKKILVLNLGSTSFKFKLYEMGENEEMLAKGSVDAIGGNSTCKVQVGEEKRQFSCVCVDHMEAMNICMETMTEIGLPVNIDTLDAIGYKAVHGGTISGSHIVDDGLIHEMERMIPFAPAHNPVYLAMMKRIRAEYPEKTQIACFETAFHATVPRERYVYGVPASWEKEYGIRRWGFHGSSHSYIAWKMSREMPEAKRVISVHLGGSCSICAIKDGTSIANSMGATPQSGVFHNNRVGDFDLFCLPALVEKMGSLDAVLKILSKESGLLSLSGVGTDIRDVEAAEQNGDQRAALAIDAFVDSVVGYIGMYTAYLGGVDAICFTGGIGAFDEGIRERIVDRLGFVNAKLDPEKNLQRAPGLISASDSGVSLWALETNEELMVARNCMKCL